MTALEGLEFPILRINERGVLNAKRPRDLKLMPEIFFARGGFEGVTFVIDPACRKYEVLQIKPVRRSYNPWYITDKYRKYIVSYDLGEPLQLSFEEARGLVMDLIVRKRWYLQGYETRPKFIKRFESYGSMREVIDSISGYGRVWY